MPEPPFSESSNPMPPSEPPVSALGAGKLMVRRNSEGFAYRPNPWRGAKAWMISSATHTILLVALALLWQPTRRGTADLIDRPVGIAVFHESKTGDLYSLTDSNSGSKAASAAMQADRAETAAPLDLSELTKDLIGYSADAGATSNAVGKLGQGISGTGIQGSANQGNSGRGQGASSSATFMGLRGSGSNFVYVLDRSASMEEFDGAPMRFARSELLKSIASLAEKNQFQIVFYNESPGSLSNGASGGRLLAANDINKEKASRFVKAIKPSGGTEHIPGLKMGLSFAPDVLFFLTDAAEPSLTESQLVEIQSRADRSSTTIHTIQFNRGPAPNDGTWIRELAERNRGTYRYIDISGIE